MLPTESLRALYSPPGARTNLVCRHFGWWRPHTNQAAGCLHAAIRYVAIDLPGFAAGAAKAARYTVANNGGRIHDAGRNASLGTFQSEMRCPTGHPPSVIAENFSVRSLATSGEPRVKGHAAVNEKRGPRNVVGRIGC